MRRHWDPLRYLVVEAEADPDCKRMGREPAIVITCAVAKAGTTIGEGEAGYQHEIGFVGAGFF